jgi:Bacterial PH domain
VTDFGMVPSKLLYRNGTLSAFAGIFFLFCTSIFIVQAFNPGKGGPSLTVFAVITAVAAGALTARCLVAPTITAAHAGVRIRTLLRTRSYDWAEVDRFNVVIRPVGSYNRKVLTITLRDGETRAFNQLNSRPSKPGWVDDAAAKLNQYVAAMRRTGASFA